MKNIIINQKKFYIDLSDYENINKSYISLETKKKINITEDDKIKIVDFLNKYNIRLNYFERFKGFVTCIHYEGYIIHGDVLLKGGLLYFDNFIGSKKFMFFIKEASDVEIIYLIITNYFEYSEFYLNFNQKLIKKQIIELMNLIDFNVKFNFKLNFKLNYNLLLEQLNFWKKILSSANSFGKLYPFIRIKFRENLNFNEIKEPDVSFSKAFEENDRKYFENFDGIVFLIENTLDFEYEYKIRRLIMFFYKFTTKESRVYYLYNFEIYLYVFWLLENYLKDQEIILYDLFDKFNLSEIIYKEYLKTKFIIADKTIVDPYKIDLNNLELKKIHNLAELKWHIHLFFLYY